MTATITPKPPVTKGPKASSQRQAKISARGRKPRRRNSLRRPVPPVRWRTLPFAGFIAALLCGGLLALLLVNNSLAAGSFERAKLKAERTLLFEQEQALNQEVLALSSPTTLRDEARQLGMVAAASSAFLDVSAGKIFGIPKATIPSASVVTPADPGSEADGEAPAESVVSPNAGEGDSEASGPHPEDNGDAARSGTDSAEARDDQATVVNPPETGDGAQVSSGTAQDRAIVSGGG